MYLRDVSNYPTTINSIHESVYRSYHILDKVLDWLKCGVPADVLLELVEEMKTAPNKEMVVGNWLGTGPTVAEALEQKV